MAFRFFRGSGAWVVSSGADADVVWKRDEDRTRLQIAGSWRTRLWSALFGAAFGPYVMVRLAMKIQRRGIPPLFEPLLVTLFVLFIAVLGWVLLFSALVGGRRVEWHFRERRIVLRGRHAGILGKIEINANDVLDAGIDTYHGKVDLMDGSPPQHYRAYVVRLNCRDGRVVRLFETRNLETANRFLQDIAGFCRRYDGESTDHSQNMAIPPV